MAHCKISRAFIEQTYDSAGDKMNLAKDLFDLALFAERFHRVKLKVRCSADC